MNIILLKNDIFEFPKVQWLQLTGEVGKSMSCLSCSTNKKVAIFET